MIISHTADDGTMGSLQKGNGMKIVHQRTIGGRRPEEWWPGTPKGSKMLQAAGSIAVAYHIGVKDTDYEL